MLELESAFDDSTGKPYPVSGYTELQLSQNESKQPHSAKGKQRAVDQSQDAGEGPSNWDISAFDSNDLADFKKDDNISDSNSESKKTYKKHLEEKEQTPMRWAIPLFMNSKDEAIPVHVNSKKRCSDFSLFTRFRQKYYKVSSSWQRCTQLRGVRDIHFVRVYFKTHIYEENYANFPSLSYRKAKEPMFAS